MTALESAIKLHDYIRSNVGETSDWPLRVTSTEYGALDELDRLLKDFRDRAMQETA